MSNQTIIRAWKDEEYRLSLSDEERALLPEHPVGPVELPDVALDDAAGGLIYTPYCSAFCSAHCSVPNCTHHPLSACC